MPRNTVGSLPGVLLDYPRGDWPLEVELRAESQRAKLRGMCDSTHLWAIRCQAPTAQVALEVRGHPESWDSYVVLDAICVDDERSLQLALDNTMFANMNREWYRSELLFLAADDVQHNQLLGMFPQWQSAAS
jgi:hypothetical protein